jgi:outer membrane immunogenic protein
MRKALIAGAAVAAFIHSAATAADLLPMTAPLPPPCMWCGFYVGGNVGWAWGRDAVTTTSTFPGFLAVDVAALNTAASPALTSNGLIGGGQVGYNWQIGSAVIGIEADADFPV